MGDDDSKAIGRLEGRMDSLETGVSRIEASMGTHFATMHRRLDDMQGGQHDIPCAPQLLCQAQVTDMARIAHAPGTCAVATETKAKLDGIRVAARSVWKTVAVVAVVIGAFIGWALGIWAIIGK